MTDKKQTCLCGCERLTDSRFYSNACSIKFMGGLAGYSQADIAIALRHNRKRPEREWVAAISPKGVGGRGGEYIQLAKRYLTREEAIEAVNNGLRYEWQKSGNTPRSIIAWADNQYKSSKSVYGFVDEIVNW